MSTDKLRNNANKAMVRDFTKTKKDIEDGKYDDGFKSEKSKNSMIKNIDGFIKKAQSDIESFEKKGVGPAGKSVKEMAGGGLAEATAKLKAKGFKEGGMVVKEKTVAMDKSPNSGLITTKGFGAGRRT